MYRFFFNFAFTDLHTIATIKASEHYSSIAEGFKDVLSEINHMKDNPMITVDGKIFK